MPWMLGSLFACLLASLSPLPVSPPMIFRPAMSAVLGVMMGASYSPAVLGQIGGWWITLLGLVGFMIVAGAACVSYFRFVAGFDFRTAYFAGMPGGLVEMVLIGEQAGADMRRVALVHAARIVITVFTIPFIVQWLNGGPIQRGFAGSVSLTGMDPSAIAWFLGTLICGMFVGRYVKLPARHLMGPMIVSVIVHSAGWSTFKAPWELVLLAQLVLGATIGCRFAGTRAREVLHILLLSLGSTVILIAFSIAFAWLISRAGAYTLTELLLAYSPGGLAEMGLLALALQLEVVLVSSHHILRIIIVVIGATALMPLFGIKK